MKLKLVEPFTARPAPSDDTEEALDIQNGEGIAVAHVDEEASNTSTDDSEHEVEKGLSRFLDFLSTQRQSKESQAGVDDLPFRLKVIQAYQVAATQENPKDSVGNRYNTAI